MRKPQSASSCRVAVFQFFTWLAPSSLAGIFLQNAELIKDEVFHSLAKE
jgi:hypothetical protein